MFNIFNTRKQLLDLKHELYEVNHQKNVWKLSCEAAWREASILRSRLKHREKKGAARIARAKAARLRRKAR